MAGWRYENAGMPSDPLEVLSIEVTPDPPKSGDTVNATILASIREEIKEGACLDVTIKLGLVKLFEKRFDLFKKLRGESGEGDWTLTLDTNSGDAPIKTGTYHFSFACSLKNAPKAELTIDVRGTTADEDDLGHLRINLDLRT